MARRNLEIHTVGKLVGLRASFSVICWQRGDRGNSQDFSSLSARLVLCEKVIWKFEAIEDSLRGLSELIRDGAAKNLRQDPFCNLVPDQRISKARDGVRGEVTGSTKAESYLTLLPHQYP